MRGGVRIAGFHPAVLSDENIVIRKRCILLKILRSEKLLTIIFPPVNQVDNGGLLRLIEQNAIDWLWCLEPVLVVLPVNQGKKSHGT